jgi:DNA polymerase-1
MHCSQRPLFAIDGKYLVKASYDAFLGAPMLMVKGTDHTLTYGVTRELLLLRQAIGATRLVVIFGKEALAVCRDPAALETMAAFLRTLGVQVFLAAASKVIDISLALLRTATHFVSEDLHLLQLLEHDCEVLVVGARREITNYAASDVYAKFGVSPKLIPDLLVLTRGPNSQRLTNFQAIRLLERFGGLEALLQSLASVKHVPAAGRLKGNEARLREDLARLLPSGLQPDISELSSSASDFDKRQHREILHSQKYHSLVRLLATPESNRIKTSTRNEGNKSYEAVVDAQALAILVSAVRAATHCSIDTESTGKDPRRVDLLGVSFCMTEGEAFYLPVNTDDLRGIETYQVLNALKEIGGCGTKFVGQNLKYDYVLLRRYGVELSNLDFDTMLAAHECFRDWEFFNLNHLSKKLLGRTIKEYKEIVRDSQSLLDVPFRILIDYACEDADTALRLWKILLCKLQAQGIHEQFHLDTMPLALKLAMLEFEGVTVDEHRLRGLRDDAWRRKAVAGDTIHHYFDKIFDVDSDLEVNNVLSRDGQIGIYCKDEHLTPMFLERLAGKSLAAKLFVEYRRERDALRRIEEVLESSHDGKVHPIFNQISSRFGQVSSRSPDLFGVKLLRSAMSESVAALYSDSARSLNNLAVLAGDQVLSKDVENGHFLEPDCNHVDIGEFLLSLAIGSTDSGLSRKFLIGLTAVFDLKHRLRMRYRAAFHWLEMFEYEALRLGFAEDHDRRFFAPGLKSSNLYKRRQARNLCVRWILRH